MQFGVVQALQELETASDEGLLNVLAFSSSVVPEQVFRYVLWVMLVLKYIIPYILLMAGKDQIFGPLETAFLTGQDAAQLAAVLHSNSAQAWWQVPKPNQ